MKGVEKTVGGPGSVVVGMTCHCCQRSERKDAEENREETRYIEESLVETGGFFSAWG